MRLVFIKLLWSQYMHFTTAPCFLLQKIHFILTIMIYIKRLADFQQQKRKRIALYLSLQLYWRNLCTASSTAYTVIIAPNHRTMANSWMKRIKECCITHLLWPPYYFLSLDVFPCMYLTTWHSKYMTESY